jgi:hypothetical protein
VIVVPAGIALRYIICPTASLPVDATASTLRVCGLVTNVVEATDAVIIVADKTVFDALIV